MIWPQGAAEMRRMMKLRYPQYYESFSCIAGQCEDTCCAGWEIDIDDASYEYYMQLPGEIGDRIRDAIKEYRLEDEDVYESHGFILQEGMRCPFLNENNLCDIILELGEDAICDVCTYTPRNFLEYGNAREISISPSCAEAGRLILGSDRRMELVERECDESLEFEESEEELLLAEKIRQARDRALRLLQNRSRFVEDRICDFIFYAAKVQEHLNQNDLLGISAQEDAWEQEWKTVCHMEKGRLYAYFEERMETFSGLESINEEWEHTLERICALFLSEDGGRERYEETFWRFRTYIREQKREYEWEQLIVYYAFLLLARSVDGLNFWGKAQLCISSCLMIRDMALERFYQNGYAFLLEDFVDVARIYAKEVEHSQENLDFLEEEFLFEDIYRRDALCVQVMPDGTN